MATSFTLGKNQRLKSRKLIGQLFEGGKTVSAYPLRILFLTSPSTQLLQAGFTVSSKNFKKATDRNRIKRLMREAYRLQKQDLEDTLETRKLQLVLFCIYSGKEKTSFEIISVKMKTVLELLVKQLNISEGT